MDSTLNRPAVDVAPDRPRPGLAFALALLSVPGTTIAWDLPAGGLWIGLPWRSPPSSSACAPAGSSPDALAWRRPQS